MSSTVKCEYCGATILSSDQTCPNCGAANKLYVNDTEAIITDPKTIDELKEYCAERGMPLLRMRFFIGEDCKEAKAFGIFKDDDGNCVVYKNKDDGTRAVRYKGKDEAFAVGELFQKLLDECHKRGIYPDGKSSAVQKKAESTKKKIVKGKQDENSFWNKWYGKIVIVLLIGVVSIFVWEPALLFLVSPLILIPYGIYKFVKKSWTKTGLIIWAVVTAILTTLVGIFVSTVAEAYIYPPGYYYNDDQLYYHYQGDWYTTDEGSDDWYEAGSDMYSNISSGDYVDTSTYTDEDYDDWDVVQFEDSDTYEYITEVDDTRNSTFYYDDDDDDWSSSDYGSWDSGSTDWSSDW